MPAWSPQLYYSGWVSTGPVRGATWASPVQYQQPITGQQQGQPTQTTQVSQNVPITPITNPVTGAVSGWLGIPQYIGTTTSVAPSTTEERVLSWLRPQSSSPTLKVQQVYRAAPAGALGQEFVEAIGEYQPGFLEQWKQTQFLTAESDPRWYTSLQYAFRQGKKWTEKPVSLLGGGTEKVKTMTLDPSIGSIRTLTSEERKAIAQHNKALDQIQALMQKYPNWVNDPRLQARIEELRQKLLPGQSFYINPEDTYVWEKRTEKAEQLKGTPVIFKEWAESFQRTLPEEEYLSASNEQARRQLAELVAKQKEFWPSAISKQAFSRNVGMLKLTPYTREKQKVRDIATDKEVIVNPIKYGSPYRLATAEEQKVLHAHNLALDKLAEIMRTPNWASDKTKVQEFNKWRQYLLPGVNYKVSPMSFLIPIQKV